MAADNSKGTGFNIKNLMGKNGQIHPITAQVTEDRYFIPQKLREDLEGVIATMSKADRFGREMGHRNYLLTGSPGTGKTLGVQYIATKLGWPLYDAKTVSSAQQIAQLYQQLRELIAKGQKVIVMFDEVDRFSSREEIVDPSQQQTLNQLLAEMDGVDSNNGIYVFGMTNKPDKIDHALRRPGRFSKEIEFMPPDRQGRLAILKMHAHKKGDHKFEVKDADLEYVADHTFGYTGADLRGLLDESFTKATLRDTTKVAKDDLDHALKRTKPSALRDMPFKEPKKKLEDIGGYGSHKEIMKKVISNDAGSMSLLYGPGGTGKTEFAEALAGEFGFNYIVVSGSEPEDKFVGETGKKIDKYLTRAKLLAPCILTFDEMDALVEKKGIESWKSSWTGLLQSRLSRQIEGVHVIGTMNRPDLVNNAFVQRFPHRLYFGMPTKEEQEEIWRKYVPPEIDVKKLVEANGNLTGRDIAHAALIVKSYGIPPSVDVYGHIITSIRHAPEVDYTRIRDSVGDSVRDYENVKKFITPGETHGT